METQNIVIHSAMYGVGVNKEKDVTGAVAELVAKGATSVVASNDILGDPALGMVKRLNVKYSVDGVDHDETVDENRMIVFAPPESEPVDDTPADDPPADDPVDLSDISYSELQSMCKAAELPANGSKEELIERLTKPTDSQE